MIINFKDELARTLFEDETAGKGFPSDLVSRSVRKLGMLNAARALAFLASFPGNRLEALKGDRQGQHSIRLNDQWRICFRWDEGHVHDVEIVDYH